MMNIFDYTAHGTSFDPVNYISADAREMQLLHALIREERVVDARPRRWIWDPEQSAEESSWLEAEMTLPGCDIRLLCAIHRSELERTEIPTPDSILFCGIRVVLSLDEGGLLRGSRKRAQEITSLEMADLENRDRVYEATILHRRRNGYVVLVNDHQAYLPANHVQEGLGQGQLLWREGQTLPVRFGHMYPNGHMFVYSAEMYPSFRELSPGMFLPCEVLAIRPNHVLVSLTPNITATAYIPEYGTLRVGDVLGGRIAKCGKDETGSYYVRVKLFPEATISRRGTSALSQYHIAV